MAERNFKDDMAIDKNRLDEEWERQPALYAEYTELSADANQKLARAAEKVKTIRSRVVLYALSGQAEQLGNKPTGPAIEAYYRTDDDYKKAKEEWLVCSYDADQMNNALFALNHRKAALENLVKLQLNNYYSRTITDREGLDQPAVEKIEENVTSGRKGRVVERKKGRGNAINTTQAEDK